ncbi:CoA transferase [Aneurinibacillus sp. BA2021]|nr:CoA transferase [Aneurinibacillus sp. BA2021]
MLPLEGVTVVSLEQAVAAPFATRQLADLGARVIKVERPQTGDFARQYDTTVHGLSSHFVWINRSKESMELDLKDEDGQNILYDLLAKADVFVQNLAPGAIERLGFHPAELRKKFPELIICGISGYGTDGPYRDKKAYDLLIQCESGLVSLTGTEETPCKVGISIADIAAGMYAYTGILTALLQRQKTGEGAILEISMLEALGEWMGYPMYYGHYSGEEPKRTGARHATIYPYGPFAAGDGKSVFLAIQNEREWMRFCEVLLEQPSLAFDPRFNLNHKRVKYRKQLEKIIIKACQALSSDEVMVRLEQAKIANARMNTIHEFVDHPQLAARGRWREVQTEAGPIRALLPPVTMQGLEARMDPVPRVGEHTEAILAEIGRSKKAVQKG